MNSKSIDEDASLSDEQMVRLVEWDEALANGIVAPQSSSVSIVEDLRLAKQIRCMKLLRQAVNKSASDERTPHTPSGSITASSAEDLPGVFTPVFPTTLGKYELREELGRGGYGVVFLAYDRAMGREVALKVPHASVLMRDELLMRFRIEARAAALLDHPNIVQVYDAGNIGPVLYIASAYCPGTSLHDWLTENAPDVAPQESAKLIICLAQAIQHANERGVFHRDLKPANILLQPTDGFRLSDKSVELTRRCPLTQLTPKIADFGLAKLNDETFATVSGAVLGTPAYMAPEQASGKSKASTSRVDVYSLGAILYQLLAGKVPFEGQTPWETIRRVVHEPPVSIRALRPNVARDLETICLKCLEKAPELRYATAGQLAEDLQRYLNHEPILARNPSAGELLLRIIRRKPLVSSLVIALVVAVVSGFVAALTLWKQSEARRVQVEQALEETAQANQVALQEQQTGLRLHYLNRIALADREKSVNLTRARELLKGCDPSFRDWEWKFLWKRCNPELLDLAGHKLPVRVCKFSPNGDLVVSGSGSWGRPIPGEVIVRQTQTGKVLWESSLHTGQVTGISFHPSRDLLATADHSWQTEKSGSTIVWDVASGEVVAKLRLGRNTFDVEFDPTGQFLATAGADGKIRFFRTENWRLQRTVLHHQQSVHDISYHPSGNLLASAGRDGRLCVFDCKSGAIVYEQDDLSDVRCVSFNSDGSQLACSIFSGHILIWDTSTWKLLARHCSPNGRVGSLEYVPDGESLLVNTINGPTQVWDVRSGQIRRTIPPHFPGTYYATASSDGSLIATCGSDARLKIWSMVPDAESSEFRAQDSFVSDLVAIPGSDWIAAGVAKNTANIGRGDGDFSIRILDKSTGKRVRLLEGHTSWTTGLDVSEDGQLLVSACLNGVIRLWNIQTGKMLKTLGQPDVGATYVAFATANQVVAASGDGRLSLWDVQSGQFVRDLASSDTPFTCLAVAKGVGWVAAADQSGEIGLWNCKKPDYHVRCDGMQSLTNCLSFSGDGRQLAAGGSDFELAIWSLDSSAVDAANNSKVNKLAARKIVKIPGREVRDIEFLPSGERLAYATTNFTGSASVRLIDTETGEEALRLIDREQNAGALLFDSQKQELSLAVNSQVVLLSAAPASTEVRWEQHRLAVEDWYAQQADLAERHQRSFATVYYLNYLISSESNKAQLYLRRANSLAAQRNWAKAESDFARYAELTGNQQASQLNFAILELARENLSGFQTYCDAMIKEWGHIQQVGAANTLAWTLALTPHRPDDLALMTERAEFAVEKSNHSNLHHESLNSLGLVLYRAQHYDKAFQAINQSIEIKDGQANEFDLIILAMIQHSLGDHAQSRRNFNLARSSFQNAVFLGNPVSKFHSRSWISRFQVQLLLDEAEKLLENPN